MFGCMWEKESYVQGTFLSPKTLFYEFQGDNEVEVHDQDGIYEVAKNILLICLLSRIRFMSQCWR